MANNIRRMRGFTADGYVRIQRTVLRRVVCDRLQALLRGDFYVRNSLGGEEYEPIVKEVEALHQNVNAAAADGSLPQAPAVATATSAAAAAPSGMGEDNNKQNQKNGNNGKGKIGMTNNGSADNDMTTTTDGKKKSTSPPPQEIAPHQSSSKQLSFSTNLETFLQLIAASIMIDASMRGENAGESDTRFIKKKKKLLVKTLMGPKLPDFCKEVLRFDTVRRGGTVSDTEIVESEESKSSSSSGESSSEEEEEEVERQRKKKKVKVLPSTTSNNISSQPMKSTVSTATTTSAAAASSSTQTTQSKQEQQRHRHHPFYPSSEGGEDGSSSMDEEEEDEDNSTTASDSNDEDGISSSANNSNAEENSMSLDGFSASATSSRKQQRKKEKKKLRALKKEKKRMKKEKKRREKERRRREREERKKKKKAKERMKLAAAAAAAETQQQQEPGGEGMKDSKKKKKRKHKSDTDAENEFSDAIPLHNQNGDDYNMDMEYITPLTSSGKRHLVRDEEDIGAAESDDDEEDGAEEEDEGEGILATKEEFEQFKSDILKRVPKSVKSRFRQGGFSRWGKDWLPILELGPFDVEPGPVRDMWFDMFDNTQASGREMTRLVLWYGVKFEDRGQAYSFLPETKIVPYEEGQRNGYCKISSKIQQKIEKKQKLTKTEEQIRRGLIEIEADMARDKSDRAAWMMQFKEDYEYAEEEAAIKSKKKKKKKNLAKAVDEATAPLVETAKKRKPGRPKKEKDEFDVPVKRKPGRPKKVVVDVSSAEEEDRVVVEVKKRGPGRPRKSEKEKEKANAKKKEATAKKWEMIDGDEESEIETDNDESDKDYDGLIDSGDEGDMDVDGDANDSDAGEDKSSRKKRKATSSDKTTKKKAKVFMTEEEKIIDRRAKAAEYREKKARERAEAQGLEYIKGKVGRKSKAAMIDEEQIKFTKCEEVFLPMMERLSEAKDDNNAKVVLKCIKSIMERVEMLTPPFLREYPLGMLVKTVRKSFEAVHPEVKDNCKCLTAEMKRVYTEKEPKVPDDFEPVKNKKSSIEPKQEASEDAAPPLVCSAPETVKSESIILKADKVTIKTDKVVINTDRVDIASEPSLSKNNSEMSLSESLPQKNVGAISTESLSDVVVKSELPQPKPKRTFSIKGMFDKPKPPAEKPKLSTLPTSSSSASITAQILVPKPKTLPLWVTGPVRREEELCSERAFGLEFLSDAASSVVVVSTKFDPISVSQSLEVAIFAETKLRGRHWNQYWEKIHDVVSILSPVANKQKSILQGIMRGDYQDPSDVVKLSRREILNSQMSETTST